MSSHPKYTTILPDDLTKYCEKAQCPCIQGLVYTDLPEVTDMPSPNDFLKCGVGPHWDSDARMMVYGNCPVCQEHTEGSYYWNEHAVVDGPELRFAKKKVKRERIKQMEEQDYEIGHYCCRCGKSLAPHVVGTGGHTWCTACHHDNSVSKTIKEFKREFQEME